MPTRFTSEAEASLSERERELWSFGERLGHLMSVQAELEFVTRGKAFVIRHEPMWQMLVASYDMIIVELASWALGFYEKGGGGFLRSLRGPDLTALERVWRPGPQEERNETARDGAFARLFPGGVTSREQRGPSQADVDALCDRLAVQFQSLHDDRNQHRAHRYEKGQPKTAKLLGVEETAKYLVTCQQLLGDLRCLSSNSSFSAYRYEPEAHRDDHEAQDVVDLILCGDMRWIIDGDPGREHAEGVKYYWQRRTAHYERLHAAHAALPSSDARLFNDPHLWEPTSRR